MDRVRYDSHCPACGKHIGFRQLFLTLKPRKPFACRHCGTKLRFIQDIVILVPLPLLWAALPFAMKNGPFHPFSLFLMSPHVALIFYVMWHHYIFTREDNVSDAPPQEEDNHTGGLTLGAHKTDILVNYQSCCPDCHTHLGYRALLAHVNFGSAFHCPNCGACIKLYRPALPWWLILILTLPFTMGVALGHFLKPLTLYFLFCFLMSYVPLCWKRGSVTCMVRKPLQG